MIANGSSTGRAILPTQKQDRGKRAAGDRSRPLDTDMHNKRSVDHILCLNFLIRCCLSINQSKVF